MKNKPKYTIDEIVIHKDIVSGGVRYQSHIGSATMRQDGDWWYRMKGGSSFYEESKIVDVIK